MQDIVTSNNSVTVRDLDTDLRMDQGNKDSKEEEKFQMRLKSSSIAMETDILATAAWYTEDMQSLRP